MSRLLAAVLMTAIAFGFAILTPFGSEGRAGQEQGCPPGLAPIGQAPGPICVPMPGYGLGPPSQPSRQPEPPPMPLPNYYGAFAADPEHAKLSWAAHYPTRQSAAQAAIESCSRGSKTRCQSLGEFRNQCAAVAINQSRKVFVEFADIHRTAARKALKTCNAASPDEACGLWKMPICASGIYGAQDNARADQATIAEMDALADEVDRREYWGAVASGNGQIISRMNRPSRTVAEREALAKEKCSGCTLKASFKNSCIGIAWPADDRHFLETVVNRDPQAAEAGARRQCAAKYGQCVGTARCSGRTALGDFPHGAPQFDKATSSWRDK